MERQTVLKKSRFDTATMIKVSFLGAISFVLMTLEFAIPIFPSFLKMDISDIPSLIGGFALGPVVGVFIQLMKNLMKIAMVGTHTGFVGELSNFFIGSSFVVTASLIYKNHKGIKSAVFACICATITMTFLGALSNYFVMLPLYSKFMPMEAIISMGHAINSSINDTKTLVLYAIVPFNILKGVLISALTMLLYKKISPILKPKS